MSLRESLAEFEKAWLPHVSNAGLKRLVYLLEQASPLLIHGSFARVIPQGCLASHIGWNHPDTACWDLEAGVMWLCRVAELNPATSKVVTLWDEEGLGNLQHRYGLLEACQREIISRASADCIACKESDCMVTI